MAAFGPKLHEDKLQANGRWSFCKPPVDFHYLALQFCRPMARHAGLVEALVSLQTTRNTFSMHTTGDEDVMNADGSTYVDRTKKAVRDLVRELRLVLAAFEKDAPPSLKTRFEAANVSLDAAEDAVRVVVSEHSDVVLLKAKRERWMDVAGGNTFLAAAYVYDFFNGHALPEEGPLICPPYYVAPRTNVRVIYTIRLPTDVWDVQVMDDAGTVFEDADVCLGKVGKTDVTVERVWLDKDGPCARLLYADQAYEVKVDQQESAVALAEKWVQTHKASRVRRIVSAVADPDSDLVKDIQVSTAGFEGRPLHERAMRMRLSGFRSLGLTQNSAEFEKLLGAKDKRNNGPGDWTILRAEDDCEVDESGRPLAAPWTKCRVTVKRPSVPAADQSVVELPLRDDEPALTEPDPGHVWLRNLIWFLANQTPRTGARKLTTGLRDGTIELSDVPAVRDMGLADELSAFFKTQLGGKLIEKAHNARRHQDKTGGTKVSEMTADDLFVNIVAGADDIRATMKAILTVHASNATAMLDHALAAAALAAVVEADGDVDPIMVEKVSEAKKLRADTAVIYTPKRVAPRTPLRAVRSAETISSTTSAAVEQLAAAVIASPKSHSANELLLKHLPAEGHSAAESLAQNSPDGEATSAEKVIEARIAAMHLSSMRQPDLLQ